MEKVDSRISWRNVATSRRVRDRIATTRHKKLFILRNSVIVEHNNYHAKDFKGWLFKLVINSNKNIFGSHQ